MLRVKFACRLADFRKNSKIQKRWFPRFRKNPKIQKYIGRASLLVYGFSQKSENFRKNLQIFAKICQFSQKCANFRKNRQMFAKKSANVRKNRQIFARICKSSQTFANFRKNRQIFAKIDKFSQKIGIFSQTSAYFRKNL